MTSMMHSKNVTTPLSREGEGEEVNGTEAAKEGEGAGEGVNGTEVEKEAERVKVKQEKSRRNKDTGDEEGRDRLEGENRIVKREGDRGNRHLEGKRHKG